MNVKCILVDSSGKSLGDSSCYWTVGGGGIVTDISPQGTASASATYSPTSVGFAYLTAMYSGDDNDVSSTVANSPALSIQSNQVVQSISSYAGNNQSAVVGQSLSAQLQARVLDTFGLPVAGISVTFSVQQGGGSITGTNPAITNASGIASITYQVGTVAGSSSQVVRATATSTPSKYVDFTATSIPGTATQIQFSTQPTGTYATSPFSIQPVVRLLDAFNNVATNYAGNVVLTVATGSGSLSGTKSVTVSNGVASFSGLSYSISETGVQLKATATSLNVNSAAFDVTALPPGNCLVNDSNFYTSEGGCKDAASGLVWSKTSTSSLHVGETLWDSSYGGSGTIETSDYGRSNEFDESTGFSCVQDTTASSYCHSLSEGGYTDWRTPTLNELIVLAARTPSSYIQNLYNENVITSTCTSAGNIYFHTVNIITGAQGTGSNGGGFLGHALCVRGGTTKQTPSKLSITQSTTVFGKGITTYRSWLVRIQDPSGNNVNRQNITISLATNLGNLSGTTSAVTDASGLATFSSFSLDTPGTATLTFSTSGLTSATQQVSVKSVEHPCYIENADWITAEGGCKNIGTHLVWSRMSSSSMTWFDAVWDSTVSGNPAPDAYDGSLTEDYDGTVATAVSYPDQAGSSNYCHDLVEGGYSDWRMPTSSELMGGIGLGTGTITFPETVMGVSGATYFWSSTTSTSNVTGIQASYMFYGSGVVTYTPKSANAHTICVRRGN